MVPQHMDNTLADKTRRPNNSNSFFCFCHDRPTNSFFAIKQRPAQAQSRGAGQQRLT